jgi:hypothetical protein
VQPDWLQKLKEAQGMDEELQQMKRKTQEVDGSDFHVDGDSLLCFRGRYCVLKQEDIRQEILTESHRSKLSIHPGKIKMYRDMKQQFWWNVMKKDIAEFVARCLTCQKVKVDYKCPG